MDVQVASDVAVAVGTLTLAWATYQLVRKTGTLAEQTQRDVEGQFLPIVLSLGHRASGAHFPEDQTTGEGDWITSVSVAVENVGRGPALDVHLHVPADMGFEHARPISLGPGAHSDVEVQASSRSGDPPEALLPFDVHVRYRSVGGNWYATRMTAAWRNHHDEPVYVWGTQYLGAVAVPDGYDPIAGFRPD